jgi:hypothetical protein
VIRVSTRRRQREIPPEFWQDPTLIRAPYEAQATGMKLWGYVDDEGRAEMRPDLIAAHVAPGRDVIAQVEDHLLALEESGFLRMYPSGGSWWIQLRRPLKTPRPLASECPPDPSGSFLAVGRARAEERVRAEQAERAGEWAAWAGEQERTPRPPRRPLLLDAPPIGCPDHPDGRYEDCGPCGTARRRHDKWVQQERYTQQIAEQAGDDDEPF